MSRPNTTPSGLPPGYPELLADLKGRIRSAQVGAALCVNRELVLLYWQVGRSILRRQGEEGWGAKVIDRLSGDLCREFPEMKGFSPRNLKYMRAFAEAWEDDGFVQQVAAQIPWFHNCVILDKLKDRAEREWYVRETVKNGWSRNVLVHQIESDLFRRQGKAVTNLRWTLPPPQSDLAQEILKDPYNFDFLSLGERASERDLHRSLLAHLRDFLIELGVGFAFVGSEHPLEVGGQDFRIDLFFYHLRLRCYVVVELKIGDFAPEHVGKLNFYLSAVDDLIRDAVHDGPTIGILLCKTKNRVIAEYALRDLNKPVGISSYRLEKALAGEMKRNLPTIEELEAELGGSKPEP